MMIAERETIPEKHKAQGRGMSRPYRDGTRHHKENPGSSDPLVAFEISGDVFPALQVGSRLGEEGSSGSLRTCTAPCQRPKTISSSAIDKPA